MSSLRACTKGDMPTMAITVVFGLLVVIGACLAAVAGLELVQRLVPAQKRQEDARSYAQEVVDTEWPRMDQGLEGVQSFPEGWDLIDDMRATLQEVEVRTAADQALYTEGLDQIERLNDARRMRFVAAEEGIPGVLWAVLV